MFYLILDVHCESPPAIQHGIVRGIKSGDNYLPYDEVEIQCESGYKYSGTTEFVMCEEDGMWEEDFAACVGNGLKHPDVINLPFFTICIIIFLNYLLL